MLIFKQSRYVALLVGVILVCFSAITLLHPGAISEGKQNRVQMVKLQSSGLPAVPQLAIQDKRSRIGNKEMSKLNAVAPILTSWEMEEKTKWLSVSDLIHESESVSSAPTIQAAAAEFSPAASKALQQKKTAAMGNQQANKKITASQHYHPPTTLFFSRTKLLSQNEQNKATWRYAVSEEDVLLLQKIVMAEAEGEPYQGKVAVVNVVLNRLRSANFPDTIKDVIYQKSQFSPVANGRLKRVKPNEDSVRAVKEALSGVKEVSDDTYFFLSLTLAQDLTVHHSRKYAKTIGNHTFYK